jgi:D-alanine-D-alanine ligase
MGHSVRRRVVIVHNRDFEGPTPDPTRVSRADVENAARDVERALKRLGVEVERQPIPTGLHGLLEAVAAIQSAAPDLVFNLCESLEGDARHEAVLPSLLELAGIPYTGSSAHALGIALRKDVTKRLLQAAGVPTPEGVVVETDQDLEAALALGLPAIVKPTREDASVGIGPRSVVRTAAELAERTKTVLKAHRQPALVERYVEGRELYVTLLAGGRADELEVLPLHEIDFSAMPAHKPRIVTYDAKWDPESDEWAGTRSVRAQPIEAGLRARIEAAARAAFRALELSDYARVDLRLAEDGTPYVIDVNPNCDLSDGAGVCRAASYAKIEYADLIGRICDVALARARAEKASPHVHPDLPEDAPDLRAGVAPCGGASAPPPAERSRGAGGAGVAGRPVYAGGDLGRARADRRRAR